MNDDKEERFVLPKYKLAKMGVDYIVWIPRKLIKYKIIDPEKKYNIIFQEIKEIKDEED